MSRPLVLSSLLFALPCAAQTPAAEPPKPAPTPVVVESKPVAVKETATSKPADAKVQDPKPATGTTNAGTEPPKPQPQDQGKEPPKTEQPVPAGADPSDLRAIRGAQAMIDAEKKLNDMIRSGKITGLDKVLPFDELTSWQYEDGLKGMPKRIRDLSGKKVLMTGFMLPIDEVQHIKEFLLVQSLWSCCYGQPPDIHGFVRVVMPKGKTSDYFFDPIKVIGKFKVEATVMDGYCVDIYQLETESIEIIK
jgi:hypothetical protein